MSYGSPYIRAGISSIATLSAVVGCGNFSQAVAQPPSVVVQGQRVVDPDLQRLVYFGDLDLAHSPGRDRLMRRVNSAINGLCDSRLYSPILLTPDHDCVNAAWSSADPQIDAVLHRVGSTLTTTALIVAVPR